MEKLAVLDSGGQYCHLIARKVRELGVYAEILPVGILAERLSAYKGVILSGGPARVSDENGPRPDPDLFDAGKPILGICYGHHLIARYMRGGTVYRRATQEFGSTDLTVLSGGGLFDGMESTQRVWMSHGDYVGAHPDGFEVLALTEESGVAAMRHPDLNIYGIQFHPEVVHTPGGSQMLENFLRNVCECSMDWRPQDRIQDLVEAIRSEVGSRRVLFFLSGGVDSTVAFALTVRALRADSVEAVYVDTGLMRKGETKEIKKSFGKLDFGDLHVEDKADMFIADLENIVDPEEKRAAIGKAFVDVLDEILSSKRYSTDDWMLGQGTIYPDTIESGGTESADVIKTHHNRVDRIQKLISSGRVVEPLKEFYKDEVRELGRALGLSSHLVERHPFPGPGLAIRCLCADDEMAAEGQPQFTSQLPRLAKGTDYQGFVLPLRSVGVQGDSRSYRRITVLHGGELRYEDLLPLATAITNEEHRTNRVVVALNPKTFQLSEWGVRPATVTSERVNLLRNADDVVTKLLRKRNLYSQVWQCPVVLLPFGRHDQERSEAIVLRPVTSVDGMTAAVAELPPEEMQVLARQLCEIDGIDAVLYDISSKPPATIEWE